MVAASPLSRLAWPALVAVLALVCGVIGWGLMHTTFMVYDDEGYVLIGYREFAAGHALYTDIFSQYGPVPFLYHEAWHRITGAPVTHSLGRALTCAHWVLAALAAGWLARLLADRRWVFVPGTVLTFGYLWPMTSEPAHPGGLITLITALALAGAVAGVIHGRERWAAMALGTAGGLLLLTKVNVGVFWLASVVVWYAAVLGVSTWERRGRAGVEAAFVILPFGLMLPLLHEGWALILAKFFAVAALLVLGIRRAIGSGEISRALTAPLTMIGGVVATVLLIVGLMFARGSTLGALLEGVILAPLRHPLNFSIGLSWTASIWIAWVVANTLVVGWLLRPDARARWATAIAVARLMVLAVLVAQASTWMTHLGLSRVTALSLPLLPLFVVPLGNVTDTGLWRARLLVALVGMGQVLHIYPVAVSQMAWGSFLLIPLAVVGWAEAIQHLARRARWSRLRPVLVGVLLVLPGWQLLNLGSTAWQRWHSSLPLELPGAEHLRLPETVRGPLRILSLNASIHADVLYSRPGLFSFNLWTELPTPTRHNATHWFWLLNEGQQQAIATHLAHQPRAAVITHRTLEAFIRDRLGIPVEGPLQTAIARNFIPLFSLSDYDFMLRTERQAVPFFIIQHYTRTEVLPDDPHPHLIEVNVGARVRVAAIEYRDIAAPPATLARLGPFENHITATPINRTGQVLGEERVLDWPYEINGLLRLRIYHRDPAIFSHPARQLVFLDESNRILFEAWPATLPTESAAPNP
jgi:hypothetical protein